MPSHHHKVHQDIPLPSGGDFDDLRTPIWTDDIPDELWGNLEDVMPDQQGRRLVQKVRFKLQETQAKSVNAYTVLSLLCATAAISVIKGPPFWRLLGAIDKAIASLRTLADDIKSLDLLRGFYDIPNENRVIEIVRKENETLRKENAAMETRILAAIYTSHSSSPEISVTTHFKKEEDKSWKWNGLGEPESGPGEWVPHTFKKWTS